MSLIAEPQRPATRAGVRVAVVSAVAAAVVFVWLVAGYLAGQPPLPARPQTDRLTTYVSALADLSGRLSALVTLGCLMGIAAFTPLGAGATLTADGQRLARVASRSGQVWLWSAMLMTFANTAYVNGVPMGYTLPPGAWWTFQWATPSGLAWLLAAVVALAVVVTSYLSRHYAAYASLLIVGVLAMTYVAVTGNVSVGLDHDWATDAAIAVSLALLPLAAAAAAVLLRGTGGDRAAFHRVRRYHRLVWPMVAVAGAGHLLIAWQQLAGTPVLATAYGLPTGGFFCCLLLLLASAGWRRASGAMDPGRGTADRALASVVRDVVVLIAYVAFLAAANSLPPPRFLVPQSIQVNYLGYEVDTPATPALLLSLGRPNILWVLLTVTAVGAYLGGVHLVRRQGGRWPVGRTALWLTGWGITLFLAVTGLWEYSTAVFSWHMVVHMTVNMTVPALCVLGGPLTLAVAAARDRPEGELPGLGQAVRAFSEYRPLQRLLSPPVLWLNYVGSLFLVYYTPIFPWLMRYHWAHQVMLLYFMVTGYVFFNLLIGVDRASRGLLHLIKLALVLSIMPFHAIFAVGILSSQTLFGESFYRSLDVAWVGDLLADQNVAGQATWILGEVPMVIVIVALAYQWFTQDKVEAGEFDGGTDGGTDDAFRAYNDMLAELAERDRDAPPERPPTVRLRP